VIYSIDELGMTLCFENLDLFKYFIALRSRNLKWDELELKCTIREEVHKRDQILKLFSNTEVFLPLVYQLHLPMYKQ